MLTKHREYNSYRVDLNLDLNHDFNHDYLRISRRCSILTTFATIQLLLTQDEGACRPVIRGEESERKRERERKGKREEERRQRRTYKGG